MNLIKRYLRLLIFFTFILIFLNFSIFAQEKDQPFSIFTLNLAITRPFTGTGIIFGANYTSYFTRVLGAGIGIDFYYDTPYKDLYSNIFLRFAIGRFFIDGGISMILINNYVESSVQINKKINPYFDFRWDIVLFDSESGTFNLYLLGAFMVTKIPVLNPDTGNFFADILYTILFTGVGIVFNAIKFGIGISYSFYI